MASLDLAAILPQSIWQRIEPALRARSRNAVLAGAALATAIVVAAVAWSWSGSYSVLYAGLSNEEGGRAIGELQKLNIPYQTAEGGRVILVPSADLGRARLELALRGVPKRDGDQWALLDNESLGVSPFVEQVHYVRAVESALSQTIREVDGVVSATVKLALPKDTDFLGDAPKPSASVMLRLLPGLQLGTAQVDGIAGLVAASVPGLARDNVTVVDQTGKVLSQRGQEGLQQVPEQLGITRDIERRYEASVTDLLAPVLGGGNFRVSVDADIDFSRSKESSIKYGDAHVLSQEESVHARSAEGEAAIGIPGALSNRPPATPSTAAAAPNPPLASQTPNPSAATQTPNAPATTANRPDKAEPPDTHRTTNYDLDHTVQYLEHPTWMLRAVNVAVLVNDPTGKPMPAERIESIKTLVASAIGIGQNRHIAVVDLPFEDSPSETADPMSWWADRWVAAFEQNALLALAGLSLLFGGLLPLLRRVEAIRAAVNPSFAIADGAITDSGTARRGGAGGAPPAAGPAFRPRAGLQAAFNADPETVRTLVINEPGRTAQVIKEWIARDRNRLKQTG